MPSLEVVIGLILIILFYSLLATIVMEFISNILSIRGKHLEKVIKNMIAPGEEKGELFEKFQNSALYQQLAGRFYNKKTPPSYLNGETFRSILMKVLRVGEADENTASDDFQASIGTKIRDIPNEYVREVLEQLWQDASKRPATFKHGVEQWYEDVMDRASGWYRRRIQFILLGVGLFIAIIFNADTLSIYRSLVNSSQADLAQLVTLAETVSASELNTATGKIDDQVMTILERNIDNLEEPLGIGWSLETVAEYRLEDWLLKGFGWLIMAVCISKGAPFWFDLLKKAVNFRGAGNYAKVVSPAASGTSSGDTAVEVRAEKEVVG